jgi:hypothetical protein
MTLIIETGAIVSGADSYVSASDYEAWATARGIEFDSDLVEQQIRRAMDYIESLRFTGHKSTKDQPLQWPRVGVIVDGYELDYNQIPEQLKRAVYESVKAESEGLSQLSTVERKTLREKVGPIEVQYSQDSSSSSYVVAINKAVSKLIVSPNVVSRA